MSTSSAAAVEGDVSLGSRANGVVIGYSSGMAMCDKSSLVLWYGISSFGLTFERINLTNRSAY